MESPIRVLVALEQPMLRLGVKTLLRQTEGFEVVGEAGSVDEVEPAVERLRPGLVLIDARFQAASGRELLPRLAERFPGSNMLVMVDHDDDQCTVRALLARPRQLPLRDEAIRRLEECCLVALRSSARGCVAKSAPPERIVEAARAVAHGQHWAGPGLTAYWIDSVRRGLNAAPTNATLSARELEVVALVVEGLTNKEIAVRLGLRGQTVKNYISRILEKLDLSSRVELALYAVRAHLA